MTPQEEDEYVRYYCHKRPLVRPNTTPLSLLSYLTQCVMVSCVITIIISSPIHFLRNQGMNGFDIKTYSLLFLISLLIVLFVRLKKLLIICIELYQHYAPDRIRRRCICKPTCSEYAILCLQKYNVFTAIYKIYIRLTKGCRGLLYHIDEP